METRDTLSRLREVGIRNNRGLSALNPVFWICDAYKSGTMALNLVLIDRLDRAEENQTGECALKVHSQPATQPTRAI